MGEIKYKKITDFDISGKKILLRVDINSGIELDKMQIREGGDHRIRMIIPTLNQLKDAAVVIIAHQSRFGMKDCIDLKIHAQRLEELIQRPVKFVQDLFGDDAIQAIEALNSGEILVLNNVRQWETEAKVKSIEEAESTELITKLSPLFDYFVHDAFGAAHRAHVSLIGWPTIVAGPLVTKELDNVNKLLVPVKPCVWVVGGAKAIDKFRAIKYNLEEGNITKALIGGLTANLMLTAKGIKIGDKNSKIIQKDLAGNEAVIKEVCEKFADNIIFPVDMAYEEDGVRKEIATEKLGDVDVVAGDIGSKTIELFKNEIIAAKTLISNGPLGIFENENFRKGSFDLVDAMAEAADSGAAVIIGGGEMGTVAENSGKADKITVSTGGGALLSILSGEDLALLKVLREKMPN